MKKARCLTLIFSAVCILSMFTACSGDDSSKKSESKNDNSEVVTSSSLDSKEENLESEVEVQVDENAGGEKNGIGYDVVIQ